MQRVLSRLRRAFTLIELLVVIAIIAILVAILLPVLSRVKHSGWMADCTNHLRQFGQSQAIYQSNYEDYTSPWLSNLYPEFLRSEEIFTCPADESRGTFGVQPLFIDPSATAPKFLETWDTDGPEGGHQCTQPVKPVNVLECRNTAIKRCSYLYEFSWAWCSWFYDYTVPNPDDYTPDDEAIWPDWAKYNGNGDKIVSWREAKYAEQRGLAPPQGGEIVTYEDEAYGGHVPIVRCFWHANETDFKDASNPNFGTASVVLNLASGGYSVYRSDASPEGWKTVAKKEH